MGHVFGLCGLQRFAVVLYVLFGFAGVANGGSLPMDKAAETQEAQLLLKKIQAAAQRLNYTGTFIYQQGTLMRTSRITHLLEGRNEIEKLEVLDGRPREFIRTNEDITCYIPETRTLLVEKRVTKDVFPAIIATNPVALAQHYEIKKGETGRIAGYECQAVVLEPKDGLRYGYKLWAEKSTGLLLRAQTLNDKNEVIEQIAFTQLGIGNIDRRQVRPSFINVNGWRVENAVMRPVDLSNWIVKSLPPGFTRIQELRRMISDTPAQDEASTAAQENTRATQREVSQIVFSDGLAAISIFIEPGSQSRTEGSLQQGATNIIGKRLGDYWLTIVGEVPPTAIRQIANSIEFKTK
jgi:sigma-E factor negative regulatory protein RseB